MTDVNLASVITSPKKLTEGWSRAASNDTYYRIDFFLCYFYLLPDRTPIFWLSVNSTMLMGRGGGVLLLTNGPVQNQGFPSNTGWQYQRLQLLSNIRITLEVMHPPPPLSPPKEQADKNLFWNWSALDVY